MYAEKLSTTKLYTINYSLSPLYKNPFDMDTSLKTNTVS